MYNVSVKMNLSFCSFSVFLFIFSLIVPSAISISTVYLTTSCNQTVAITTGISLQSSTALYYPNSMNCYLAVTVPTNYKVVAVFRRYEIEVLSSVCKDSVNFYDGADTSASPLNLDHNCGDIAPTNITSTGTSLTVQLVTDSTAIYRGFDLILSAFSYAPCSSDQYSCTNSLCISSTLKCDNYDQCGDQSDESDCTDAELANTASSDNSALIAGIAIGVGSVVIICVLIGIYVYRQYRWKMFLKDPLPIIQQWDNQTNYPLTRKYYKTHNDGYHLVKNGSDPNMSSSPDRPSTPNSGGSSSKSIIKIPKSGDSIA
ncbi:neuropilin and tolloid-like protein 1 [Mytilus galloprovincialis]|uniref:neuropilin and tolloid-like protein 1 n=1 Tax=Mytilus edulis TaxID=6550 RepID=UPI0039F0EDCE